MKKVLDLCKFKNNYKFRSLYLNLKKLNIGIL